MTHIVLYLRWRLLFCFDPQPPVRSELPCPRLVPCPIEMPSLDLLELAQLIYVLFACFLEESWDIHRCAVFDPLFSSLLFSALLDLPGTLLGRTLRER